MRLLTRHIHRAFPELDAYDDAQCWKFIRAAQAGALVRTFSIFAVVFAGLLMGGAGVAGWVWLLFILSQDSVAGLGLTPGRATLWILGALPTLGLGPFASYFTRDRLLQWRIRYVLRIRGRCPACAYSLIGLALSERSSVLCPECGAECEVDPSLGELTLGTTGRVRGGRRGEGAESHEYRKPPLLSAAARRWIKRSLLALAFFVFVALPTASGVWEFLIRRDAAAARADRARLEAAVAQLYLSAGLKPPGTAAGARTTRAAIQNALDLSDRVSFEVHSSLVPLLLPPLPNAQDPEAPIEFPTPLPRPAPDLTYLYGAGWGGFSGINPAEFHALAVEARTFLEALRRQGMEERIRAIVDSVPELPADYPARIQRMDGRGMLGDGVLQNSAIGRYLEARAAECRDAPGGPDQAGLLAVMDLAWGLAHVLSASPAHSDWFSQLWAESKARALSTDLLMRSPDAETLAAVRAAMDRHGVTPCFRELGVLNGLYAGVLVADVFSNVQECRWGPLSSRAADARRGGEKLAHLGWYAANRDACAAAVQIPDAVWLQDWSARTWRPTAITAPLVAAQAAPPAMWLLTHLDLRTADQRGLRLLLAIEEFRLARHRPPAALAELVPEFIPAVPSDPWTGKPFAYKLVDRATDVQARDFILYSAGPDAADDGGVDVPPTGGVGQRGSDRVVNTFRRR